MNNRMRMIGKAVNLYSDLDHRTELKIALIDRYRSPEGDKLDTIIRNRVIHFLRLRKVVDHFLRAVGGVKSYGGIVEVQTDSDENPSIEINS